MSHNKQDICIRKLTCRVTNFEKLSGDVIRLFLDLPESERIEFSAGQYIDILLDKDQKRSFSMANPPHKDQQIELHIRHYDGGLFSEYKLNELEENGLLNIEGPLGSFTLQDSDRPMIMIAGGTGFAPIKSLIEHALKTNEHRSIKLYWGARTEEDLYLNSLAQAWADDNDHIEYIPVLSESVNQDWPGKTGFVHEAVVTDFDDISAYDVYVCGPPPMVKAAFDSLSAIGLNIKRIFSDSFEFASN
ncbi:MAG: FAD-binding oxidoreductase [Pseudomonadota bacterium]